MNLPAVEQRVMLIDKFLSISLRSIAKAMSIGDNLREFSPTLCIREGGLKPKEAGKVK